MVIDFGDPRSGFRHSEVVLFINKEVLSNGGSPDFYLTFQSRPWNEVEDSLHSVVADPQGPRAIKRACAWSALALGVRVAARQREQQGHRVRRLQDQVEEREGAAWALVSELQRLREERDDVVSQLHSARDDLKQALGERDALRERLIQFELSQEVTPESPDEQHRIEAWPVDAGERREALATGSQSRQDVQSEAQMASPTGLAPHHTWAQVVQPFCQCHSLHHSHWHAHDQHLPTQSNLNRSGWSCRPDAYWVHLFTWPTVGCIGVPGENNLLVRPEEPRSGNRSGEASGIQSQEESPVRPHFSKPL